MAALLNYWTLLILAGMACTCTAQQAQFENHLEHLTGVRHPAALQNKPLVDARDYIKNQFRQYGLDLHVSYFNTTIMVNKEEKQVRGENIVGVAKGPQSGGVLLVGADYGTSLVRSPLEDNGAGVAVMLEVARSFMEQMGPKGAFTQIKTVVFAAFDMNTREYEGNHPGRPGSYYFLHQWLWPFINQSVDNFSGAVILDSITKFNRNINSQFLPADFAVAFPEANERIAADNKKGDFLALVTRGNEANLNLNQALSLNYNKNRKSQLMRLQELIMKDGVTLGNAKEMFDHQAHIHFWTFLPSEENRPLPAILLTDTDVYRRSSEECHIPCSAQDFLTNTRKEILGHTSQAVAHTLADLQAERKPSENGSSMTAVPSLLMSTLLLAVCLLLY
ncbi:uncharacterized protein [Panulirus ornatus]|uniref:uncharacterized protein n=1 Tax=Panulirus ornatus TaxID=150431 RepID=UPI003A84C06A